MSSKEKENPPLTFAFAKWYGIIFAVIFLLYGGVKVILSFLDHKYDELGEPMFFGFIGLLLISVALAFNELKKWGWLGLLIINSIVVLLSLIGISHYENIILLLLSGAALGCLLAPQTKQYLFKR